MSEQKFSNTKSNWGLGAAISAAIGASVCCTIPLLLVSIGVGGTWIGSLTALAPYRWIFVTVAVGALAYAGYNEWRLSRRPDCDCETIFSSSARRILLGVGVFSVIGLLVSPWLIAPSPNAATQKARSASVQSQEKVSIEGAETTKSDLPTSFQQIVLEVEGMTCKTCPITVRKALSRVEGVYEAKATLEPPRAVVRFDPERVSVKDLTEATTKAGFPSSQKPSS